VTSRRRYRSLRELYDELNAKFWNGALPGPLRELTFYGNGTAPRDRGVWLRRVGARWDGSVHGLRSNGKRGHALGVFRPAGGFRPNQIHVLSPLGAEGERAVLAHEMCHFVVWRAGHDSRDHGGHGAPFIAELERLAAMGESWAAEEAERYRREMSVR
jgi:hypothetical protein